MKAAWYQSNIHPLGLPNKTATAIDHILTNLYTETVLKAAIFKYDLSDHFPIFFHRRMKLFIPTKDHLMNNLFSILKRNFFKVIGKKLKLYEIHVMPTHIF